MYKRQAIDLAQREPIVLLYTKDVAVWHYIQLCNPNVDLELRRERYEKAIEFMDKVQRGRLTLNLPYPAPATDPLNGATIPNESLITWGSFPPRRNHF